MVFQEILNISMDDCRFKITTISQNDNFYRQNLKKKKFVNANFL